MGSENMIMSENSSLAENLSYSGTGGGNRRITLGQLAARFFGTIVSPERTMDHIVERPGFWFPVIVVTLMQLVMIFARFPQFSDLNRQVIETQLEVLSQQGFEYGQAQIDSMVKITNYAAIGETAAGTLIGCLITAALLMVSVKIFKGQGTFRQAMAIASHSYAVTFVSVLITFLVSYITGTLAFDSSLALAFPGLKGTTLYGVLRTVDFFLLWQYTVIWVGIIKMTKLSMTKSGVIAYLPMVLWMLMNFQGLKNI